MFSLSKQRIVKSALKFTSRLGRTKWWLKDKALSSIAQSMAEAIINAANDTGPCIVEILNSNERNTVFRFNHSQRPGQSFVVKAFFLKSIEHGLKYHKYGLDEAANLLMARDKGIRVPEVYGYGHISNVLGIHKVSMVMLEDFRGCSPIGVLMRSKSKKERAKMFMQTIPLFVSLYNANCNHIDINLGAVMLSEQTADSAVFLLDFQHAVFYDKPSVEILMFEAGYFARLCSEWIPTDTISTWLDGLLESIRSYNVADEERNARERFDYYFSVGPYLSRKERKKIH